MTVKRNLGIFLGKSSHQLGVLVLACICCWFIISGNDKHLGNSISFKKLSAHRTSIMNADGAPWERAQAVTNMVSPLIGRIRAKKLSLVQQERLQVTALLTAMTQLEDIEGDIVETGTWKGGCIILMHHVLALLGGQPPVIWAADSFEGLPSRKDEDEGAGNQAGKGDMAVSRAEFDENLRMCMLSEPAPNVRVLEGWFSDTLPDAPIDKIAFLRLDGDLYESTRDVLTVLYDKVSVGGYIYVDDYGSFAGCKRAVDEFRHERNLTEPMNMVVESQGNAMFEAIWWKKIT